MLLALAEAFLSDEQPVPTVIRLLAAVVPPVAVAWSRTWPELAAGAVIGVEILSSVQSSEAGTLGAGFAGLAIVFGLAAWSRHPWPWLLALVVAGTLHDLRITQFGATDVAIDWAFIAFTIWIGRTVHRRTVQAAHLAHSSSSPKAPGRPGPRRPSPANAPSSPGSSMTSWRTR